jgi:hypothetical protein
LRQSKVTLPSASINFNSLQLFYRPAELQINNNDSIPLPLLAVKSFFSGSGHNQFMPFTPFLKPGDAFALAGALCSYIPGK